MPPYLQWLMSILQGPPAAQAARAAQGAQAAGGGGGYPPPPPPSPPGAGGGREGYFFPPGSIPLGGQIPSPTPPPSGQGLEFTPNLPVMPPGSSFTPPEFLPPGLAGPTMFGPGGSDINAPTDTGQATPGGTVGEATPPGGYYVPGQGYFDPNSGLTMLPPGTDMPGGPPIYNEMTGQWIDPVTMQPVAPPSDFGAPPGGGGPGGIGMNTPGWGQTTGNVPGGNVGAPGEGNLYREAKFGIPDPTIPDWLGRFMAQNYKKWLAEGSPLGGGAPKGGAGPRAL